MGCYSYRELKNVLVKLNPNIPQEKSEKMVSQTLELLHQVCCLIGWMTMPYLHSKANDIVSVTLRRSLACWYGL